MTSLSRQCRHEKPVRFWKSSRNHFPQIIAGKNVLQPSLGNANAVVHPAPTLFNTSMIESKHDWLFYYDGITPTIGAFVEKLDAERINLADSFGIKLTPDPGMVSHRLWRRQADPFRGSTCHEGIQWRHRPEKPENKIRP